MVTILKLDWSFYLVNFVSAKNISNCYWGCDQECSRVIFKWRRWWASSVRTQAGILLSWECRVFEFWQKVYCRLLLNWSNLQLHAFKRVLKISNFPHLLGKWMWWINVWSIHVQVTFCRVVQKKSSLFCFSSQSCVLQYFSIFFRWYRQQAWEILLTPIWIQLDAILCRSR